MTLKTHVIPKLQIVKEMVRQMFKSARFIAFFNSQHVKESNTLKKSAWQHFYHIL